MKKFLILIPVLLFSVSYLLAQPLQTSQVPGIIRDSLRNGFSEVSGLSWAKAGLGYKASFTNRNGVETEVTYDAKGKWNQIVLNSIPDSTIRIGFKNTLSSVSQGGQIVSKSRVINRGSLPVNIIIVDKSGKKTTYEINDSGKILKQD